MAEYPFHLRTIWNLCPPSRVEERHLRVCTECNGYHTAYWAAHVFYRMCGPESRYRIWCVLKYHLWEPRRIGHIVGL